MDDIFEIKFPIESNVKEKVIVKFSNKQGGAYNIFSYYWQCFVWAATIGFLRNERRPLGTGIERIFNLNIMRGNGGEKDAQALICMCIARMGTVDIMKKPTEAIMVISEYANGGFYHIMKLMENGENTFNDFEKVKQEIFSRNYDDLSTETITQPVEIGEKDLNNNNGIVELKEKVVDNECELKPEESFIWDEYDIDRLRIFYENDMDIPSIAERLGKSVYAVQYELSKLGLFEMPLNVTVKKAGNENVIINNFGDVIYADKAPLKIIRNKIYRFNLKPMCLTVKEIKQVEDEWVKGGKLLVAYSDSDIFPKLQSSNFIDYVDDFEDNENSEENRIKVNGIWYDYYGDVINNINQREKIRIVNKASNEQSVFPKKRWSVSQRRELQTYFESGMPIEQLADFFETTQDNVIEILKKLKIYR